MGSGALLGFAASYLAEPRYVAGATLNTAASSISKPPALNSRKQAPHSSKIHSLGIPIVRRREIRTIRMLENQRAHTGLRLHHPSTNSTPISSGFECPDGSGGRVRVE